MRSRYVRYALGLAFGALLLAGTVRAVDETGIKLGDRWSVVGVVGGGAKSVAVLKHNPSQKTFTLKIGDELPSELGFKIKAIKGREVVISNGVEALALGYAEAPAEEPAQDTPSRTSRFLDAYYRGLRESPASDAQASDDDDNPPLRRFPSFEDARSRFELYRAERGYRLGDSEGSGFVVNYDNFEDNAAEDNEASEVSASALLPPSSALPPLPPLVPSRGPAILREGLTDGDAPSSALDDSTPTE